MSKVEIHFVDSTKIIVDCNLAMLANPTMHNVFAQISNSPLSYVNINNIKYMKDVSKQNPEITWL
jgi:hypothetical protein